MSNPQLVQPPTSRTEMLVRNAPVEVFEAIVNPDITSQFWFTQGQRPA